MVSPVIFMCRLNENNDARLEIILESFHLYTLTELRRNLDNQSVDKILRYIFFRKIVPQVIHVQPINIKKYISMHKRTMQLSSNC